MNPLGPNKAYGFLWAGKTGIIMREAYYGRLLDHTCPHTFVYLGGDMLERDYRVQLIKRLIADFGGPDHCRVQINDPNLPGQQGIPDLTLYVDDRWALLEVKASEKSKLRPNQEWWVQKWSQTTFCSFIYPENESEVFNALHQAFGS